MGEFMHKQGAKIQKDEVRLSVKEIKALDFCRSVGWATSEEEIAEKCGMSETEAAWFNEKCIEGDLITSPALSPNITKAIETLAQEVIVYIKESYYGKDSINGEPLAEQIERLAKYILENFNDKIRGEGAVDTAIEIMKEYKNSKC